MDVLKLYEYVPNNMYFYFYRDGEFLIFRLTLHPQRKHISGYHYIFQRYIPTCAEFLHRYKRLHFYNEMFVCWIYYISALLAVTMVTGSSKPTRLRNQQKIIPLIKRFFYRWLVRKIDFSIRRQTVCGIRWLSRFI